MFSVITISVSVVIYAVVLITPEKVYAYIDPGSGSYFVQLVLGLLLGSLFGAKLYWKRIVARVKKLVNSNSKNGSDENKKEGTS